MKFIIGALVVGYAAGHIIVWMLRHLAHSY